MRFPWPEGTYRPEVFSRLSALILLGSLLAVGVPVSAQSGSVRVEVVDSASDARLTATGVSLVSANGTTIATATTDGLGRALLVGVPAGTHVVELTRFGYDPASIRVQVGSASEPVTVLARLSASALSLDAVLVTATRASETTLATPAAVSVIDRDRIERRSVLSPIDLIEAEPGVQVLNGGLLQRRYTARGNNFGTSSQMLTLTDYRYTVLPGNNHNLSYSLATNDTDIERIEQVRGPAGALYGPNTSRGVMHVITRSPFESTGTSMSVTAGGRSVRQGQFRHAQRIGERLAFKISGRLMQGDDWEVTDPAEVAARDALIQGGADPSTVKVGARDFALSVAGGEGQLEWRGGDDTRVVMSLGLSRVGNAFDPVTFGGTPVQLTDAWTGYGQLRVSKGRFFANAFTNKMRADSIVLTSNGLRLAEHSQTYVGQLQHGLDLCPSVSLTYGTEITHINGDSDGTQHNFTEDRNNLTTIDGYAHASIALSPVVDVSGAARVSYHSVLDDAVVTPNIGAVFRPAPGHAIRATFARAAFSPSTGAFGDFVVASLGPYNLRFVDAFADQTFRRDCGGPCMRSPFASDPNAYLPTDATLTWPAIVAQLQSAGIDLSGVAAPGATDVASVLATLNLDTFGFDAVTPADVVDLPGLQRLTQKTYEVGYKGVFDDRVSITADAHYNDMGPVWGEGFVGTPSVFFEATSLEAYLVSQAVPTAVAAQAATIIGGLPIGTITPEQAGDPHALILHEPQGGDVTFFGLDLGLTTNLTDRWQAQASYSWISKDIAPNVNGVSDFLFMNPKHRGALRVDFHDPDRGLDAGMGSRFVGAFPARVFLSQGEAEAFWVADANLGYRIRDGLVLTLSVENLFDRAFAEMPGLPVLGRLVLARARVEF